MSYADHVRRSMTVQEAREFILEHREEGVSCPCCMRLCKEYPRTLNRPIALWLVWLVREYEKRPGWIDFHRAPLIQGRKGGGDKEKLKHWGFQQTRHNEDPEKGESGLYRPTPSGIAFVKGKISAPAKLVIYCDRVIARSKKRVTISDALKTPFVYSELFDINELLTAKDR